LPKKPRPAEKAARQRKSPALPKKRGASEKAAAVELSWASGIMPSMDGFYNTQAWRKMRGKILKRDGYRCVVCKADCRGKGKARVDHIRPLRQAPQLALEPSNLRTLCTGCDAARHAEKGRKGREALAIGPDGYPL
jgi:5-methylcytosine-specific restriction enzyme A